MGSSFNFTPTSSQYQDSGWWGKTKDKVHVGLCDAADMLRTSQKYIEQRNKRAVELYENLDVFDIDMWKHATSSGVDGPYQHNIVESTIDTMHAEIIAARTKVQFVTFGGTWESDRQADLLTLFMSGLFQELKIHETIAPEVCLDALVFGTGFCKTLMSPRDSTGRQSKDKDRLVAKRVHPWRVLHDDIACADEPPMSLIEYSFVSRNNLLERYIDDSDAQRKIKDAPRHLYQSGSTRARVADMVLVLEGYSLYGDGRRVVSVKNGTLEDEVWESRKMPYTILKYKSRRSGFLGKGVPEILEGQQEVVNTLREKINAQLMGASPFIWVPTGSNLRESQLSTEIWRVIESDKEPKHIAYNAVPNDLLMGLERESQKASEIVGVNTIMMESDMPRGLERGSGKQLRLYNDTKSRRLMRFSRNYENFHVELAGALLDAWYFSGKPSYPVRVSGENEPRKMINIKNLGGLKDDDYVIRPYPVNFLSDMPSSRLLEIESLANFFPDEMKPHLIKMMKNPDIEHMASIIDADSDAISMVLSRLSEEPDLQVGDVPPLPFMNLERCLELARIAAVTAMARQAPDEVVEKLMDWMKIAQELMSRVPPEPPVAPAMDMAGGMAQGMPPMGMPAIQVEAPPEPMVPPELLSTTSSSTPV